MNSTGKRIATAAVAAAMAAIWWVPAAAQKGRTSPDWPCVVTLRDFVPAPGQAGTPDAIRSDNGQPYRHGYGGVECTINGTTDATHYLWLWMRFTNNSARTLFFAGGAPAQGTTRTYTAFTSRATFEVKGFAEVAWNPADPTYTDFRPFRSRGTQSQFASGAFQFDGDSVGYSRSEFSSSVIVRPLDDCRWVIWFDPDQGPLPGEPEHTDTDGPLLNPRVMALSEGKNLTTLRGYYTMPFAATIEVTGMKRRADGSTCGS